MKKTLLLVTILMSFFAQGMKADEYTTYLEDMMRQGLVASMDNSSFDQMKSASPKIAEYLQGQFITDVAEIYAPYYRDNCSLDDLKQMQTYLTSPENKALMQKALNGANSIKDDMKTEMEPITKAIMSGGTPEDIKPAECSKELSDAIDKLYSIMELDKYVKSMGTITTGMLTKSIKQMITSFASKMGGADIDQEAIDAIFAQMEGPMKTLASYMEKNMPTMVRNAYIKTFTVEEVNQLAKIQDQPFYPSFKRAQAAMYEDMPNAMDKMMNLVMPKLTEAMGDIANDKQE